MKRSIKLVLIALFLVLPVFSFIKPARAVSLRSEPLTVLEKDALKVFKLDKESRPLEYIQNEYEDKGDVVVDRATGLMWQKSGSDKPLAYEEAQEYIKKLNQEQFAGYNDWRLPTIPELMSLLEPEKQSNDLFIKPMFDTPGGRFYWVWSADSSSSESVWFVYFDSGIVDWNLVSGGYCVRVVRSWQ